MGNKFNLYDKVYHITPDSQVGVIMEVIYYLSADQFYYLVAWGPEMSTQCKEEELSYDKVII